MIANSCCIITSKSFRSISAYSLLKKISYKQVLLKQKINEMRNSPPSGKSYLSLIRSYQTIPPPPPPPNPTF